MAARRRGYPRLDANLHAACALIALSCLVPACGAPPPAREPPAPVAVAAVAEPEAPARVDLSPVEEPKALLLVARWKSPMKGVDQMLKLLGVPVSVAALLAAQDDEIAKLVDMDASFDVAVSLDPSSTDDDPKVLAALSIPLRSFELAEAWAERQGRLTPVHPGVLRLPAKAGDKEPCDLSMAVGDAPARIVCGAADRDLEALRGWLTRGLARTPPDSSDLVATLRAKPLKDRYLGLLRAQAAKLGEQTRTGLAAQGVLDPELLVAPAIVLDEGVRLLEDLDRIDFRTSLAAQPPALVTSGAVRFGAQGSWFTRALTDVNEHAGPPPAMFWRAPRDARAATWGRGGDPQLYDGVRSVLHKALAEALARAPLDAADKEAITAFIDTTPRAPASWVSAQGSIAKPARPAKPSTGARTPATAVADARSYVNGLIGWNIQGVEAPAADYVAWAKRGLALYDRAVNLVHTFTGTTKRASGADPKVRDALAFIPRITAVNAPPGWPKGTVAFDAVVAYDSDIVSLLLPSKGAKDGADDPPKKKGPPAAKGSLTLRLAIVPDGARTWIGFSADPDELKRRMISVMPGAPQASTLAAREGLEALTRDGQTWGGFFSAGDLLEEAVAAVAKEKPEHAQDVRDAFAALPNRGRTPILLVGTGAAGPAPSSAMEIRLQQGSLADVAALVTFLASARGHELWKKLDDATN